MAAIEMVPGTWLKLATVTTFIIGIALAAWGCE
jgi:hypothetical protein